jgi:ribosomal protein S18 acetylase RimI-like enzyme
MDGVDRARGVGGAGGSGGSGGPGGPGGPGGVDTAGGVHAPADGPQHRRGAPTAATEASLSWLHEHHRGPFVCTRLTRATVRAVWRLRDSVVVEQSHDRHGNPVTAPVLVALGDADDVAVLLDEVGRRLRCRRPGFVSVEASAFTRLPAGWSYAQANRWDSMWTDEPPPRVLGEAAVEVVEDEAEVQALLDVANPGSHGRPGDPRIRTWLGLRDAKGATGGAAGDAGDAGDVVAVGALAEAPQSAVAHVRGVSTHPQHRGRGLGTAVSAALTRRGLDTISPLVTLGVYTSNTTAISIYRRLGYRHDRSFVSGPIAD